MPRLTAHVLALLLTWSRLAGAQAPDSDYVERGPRFLLASTAAPVPVRVDVTRTPVLRQSISLDLNGVALGDALREVSAKAGMQLAFSNTMLPADRTVTFRADHITVAAALTELLIDAQVDVLFSRDGRAVLVRRAEDLQGGAVSGKVTDAKTGKAIPNVSVYLEGTRWRTTTGEDGAYRLVDVTAGAYTLTVSRIGYTRQTQSVTVSAGQGTTVEVRLELSASPLDAVVVTGTMVPTEVKALPTPVSVINAEDIQQQNLQRVDQVFRGQVPGAIAWEQAPGQDWLSTINIRGASALASTPILKTFIDGVEAADPAELAIIDPSSVERIEITRGPEASTLYGAGALSGVMQIFTKKGQPGLTRPQVMAKVSAGGVGGFDGQSAALQTDNAVAVLGGSETASYSLGGTYRHVGEWVPSYNSTDWGVSVGAQTAQGPLRLAASARYSDKTWRSPWDTRFQSYGPYYSKPSCQALRLHQQTYGVTASLQATPSWQHTLTLGDDQSSYSNYSTQRCYTTPADSFLTAAGAREAKASLLYHTDLSLRLGTAAVAMLTAGVNYNMWEDVDFSTFRATQTTGNLNGSPSVDRIPWPSTGYFGQILISLHERLFLTGGIRAERSPTFGGNFGTAWSPRVGAAYLFERGPVTAKVRASYGESIRAPFPGYTEAQQYPYAVVLANPALAPERQRGADGGVDVYMGRASLGVTYYNQRVIDLIDFVSVPRPQGDTLPAYQYQNVSRVHNTGWEFEGHLHLGSAQLGGTYSITNSTIQQLPSGYPAGSYQVGDNILGIPHTSAGVTGTYSPLPQTTLSASMTYIGHWTNNDLVSLLGFYYLGQPYRGSSRAYWIQYPAVTKFAVGVSQVVRTDLTAFVRAENIANDLRFESSNISIPRPRSMTVGVTVRY